MKVHVTFSVFFQLLNTFKCHQVHHEPNPIPDFISNSFALPAPGLRYQTAQSSQISRRQASLPPSSFIGNVLPEGTSNAVSQVVSLDVACQSNEMSARIVFDRPFYGIIYSKGFYSTSKCHHVKPNTGLKEFIFSVRPGRCGTQYVGTANHTPYLENVLIIQNTPGIQEVTDTARGVRCMFDESGGKIDSRQTVTANLNVSPMEHQFVTYSANTTDSEASASLDIQVGKGPFGPTASGLVRIGEMMTMVVSVEGKEKADILVRSCTAHDGSQENEIQLTDKDGCVMKKKIMGSWQKTHETGSSKMPVMAYSYFQAFKFPDKLDVFIECEVELCSQECTLCPADHQRSNKGGRGRREVSENNDPEDSSLVQGNDGNNNSFINNSDNNKFNSQSKRNGMKLAKRLRVLSPEDLASTSQDISSITLVTRRAGAGDDDVCMTMVSFVSGIAAMLVVLILSSIITAILCIRIRSLPSNGSSYLPDSSFHAFSTITGKTL